MKQRTLKKHKMELIKITQKTQYFTWLSLRRYDPDIKNYSQKSSCFPWSYWSQCWSLPFWDTRTSVFRNRLNDNFEEADQNECVMVNRETC